MAFNSNFNTPPGVMANNLNSLPEGNPFDRGFVNESFTEDFDMTDMKNPYADSLSTMDEDSGNKSASITSALDDSFPSRRNSDDGGVYRGPLRKLRQTRFEDSETDMENRSLLDNSPAKPKWDVFKSEPVPIDYTFQEDLLEGTKKFFKIVTIIVCFLITIFGISIMKGTMLLASSNIRTNLTLLCRDYNNSYSNDISTRCVHIPKWWETEALSNNTNNVTTDNLFWSDNVIIYTEVQSEPSCLIDGLDRFSIPLDDEPYLSTVCDSMTVRWVWCVTFIMVSAQMLVFIRCFWYVCFKQKSSPKGRVLLIVMILETLHMIGVTLFVYRVIPQLHSAAHAVSLMAGFSFVPSVIKATCRPIKETKKTLKMFLDYCCILIQLSAMLLWPVMSIVRDDSYWDIEGQLVWAIPVSLFLTSFGWWENYILGNPRSKHVWKKKLMDLKKDVKKTRTKIYMWVSFYKMLLILVLMTIWMTLNDDFEFGDVWDWSTGHCKEKGEISFEEIGSAHDDWFWVWIINTLIGVVVYFSARTAVKVRIQVVAFSVPLTLVTPVVLIALLSMCSAWNNDVCQFTGGFGPPSYMFWSCHGNDELWDTMTEQYLFMTFLWWLSQIWISFHIWNPKNERLAKTDKLFNMPLFEPVTVEQWLLHNRTKDDDTVRLAKHEHFHTGPSPEPDFDDKDWKEDIQRLKREQKIEETPMIYFCATLWHETKEEVTTILKSIFRSDIDQCARRKAQEHLDIIDPDFYEFEAHFFFDDAMSARPPDDQEYDVNDYVRLLVNCVTPAAREIHGVDIDIGAPSKYPTPYGGRLEWILPGGNKMVAHLKDKQKIRHKKRWSQVMYMYYFLGKRLWMAESKLKKRQTRADNTYILALDGDVDFKPEALLMLVDLMKKDPKVGAACGRIHPIGKGPMVWYQQFEYALGHWMQKSTEHVLGCVLCSPGCFSLFRGSALMENNVMHTYTSQPTEALHYVQYDQGEDRWLCTLLLQAGFKVEYSAAADALTFAPEGFNEFYNQRRRWGPSTMANILDLLLSWRTTIKANDNISILYIIYQIALFVSSFLGTGTIFLMIVESVRVAVNYQIGPWESLLLNLVPIAIFTFVCFKTKPDTQLSVAQILTVMYALLQMLVLVGIIVQIGDEGICSPSGVFFFAVAAIFVIAAIIHPQEFTCLLMGMIYFVAIPSMYMLLMMYSLTNLHVIAWGTRETVKTKTEIERELEEEEERKMKELEDKKKKSKLTGLNSLIKQVTGNEETGFTIGIDHIFRWVCCPKPAPPPDDTKLKLVITKLDQIELVMTSLKTNNPEQSNLGLSSSFKSNRQRRQSRLVSRVGFAEQTDVLEADLTKPLDEQSILSSSYADSDSSDESIPKIKRDDMINPYWIEDHQLGNGPIGKLPEKETTFFDELIKQYLFPIPKDEVKQEKIEMELLDLRNKVSFAFYLLNSIFIVAVFTLQRNVDNIHLDWPCGKSDNLMLEPIGFMFVGFFGIIMLVQFFGMLVHRMGTFLHLVAATNLRGSDDGGVEDTVIMAKEMIMQREDDDDDAMSTQSSVNGIPSDEGPRRRKTIYKLERNLKRKPIKSNLIDVFDEKMDKLNQELDETEDAAQISKNVFNKSRQKRQSVSAIGKIQEKRRISTVHGLQRKKSTQQGEFNDIVGQLHSNKPIPPSDLNLSKAMQQRAGVVDYLRYKAALENSEPKEESVSQAVQPPASLTIVEETRKPRVPQFMGLFNKKHSIASNNSSLGTKQGGTGVFRSSSRSSTNSVQATGITQNANMW